MNDVQLDNAVLRSAVTNRGGMVDKHIEKVARTAYAISQGLVPQPGRERPPINATGRLKKSGSVKKGPQRSWDVEYAAPYAVYVELGTRYMRPEPYLRPAMLLAVKQYG